MLLEVAWEVAFSPYVFGDENVQTNDYYFRPIELLTTPESKSKMSFRKQPVSFLSQGPLGV